MASAYDQLRSMTTLILGAQQANDQAHAHRPPSELHDAAKNNDPSAYEGCHACTTEFCSMCLVSCPCCLAISADL